MIGESDVLIEPGRGASARDTWGVGSHPGNRDHGRLITHGGELVEPRWGASATSGGAWGVDLDLGNADRGRLIAYGTFEFRRIRYEATLNRINDSVFPVPLGLLIKVNPGLSLSSLKWTSL